MFYDAIMYYLILILAITILLISSKVQHIRYQGVNLRYKTGVAGPHGTIDATFPD